MSLKWPFRPPTLDERREYYIKEFSLASVERWFKTRWGRMPQICALDAGSESGIIIDRRFGNTLLYIAFDELKQKILQYVPEDIYYDSTIYKKPKHVLRTLRFVGGASEELAFDVDAENIPCANHGRGELCRLCLSKAYKASLALYDELKKEFRRIEIVYSGKGFHVHVFDREAFTLSKKERAALGSRLSSYPIDLWVTIGKVSLLRMPYTLHGEVSRKVLPLLSAAFKEEKTIPKFLMH